VGKYLSSFDNEQCGAITVRHLITHRSGLPLGPIMNSFYEFENLESMAARAAACEMDFAPGSAFGYSDPGSDTLAAVVAKASGLPLSEFLQKRILDPLKMGDTLTLFNREDPRAGRVASLFAGTKGTWMRVWKPYHPLYPFTCGSQSLYCTPRDYALFLAAWMDGKLISAEAKKRALEPASDMNYPTGFNGLNVKYGQMWMLWIGERLEAFGHGGSDGTMAWAWPERDLMVLFFTQSRGQRTPLELESHIQRLLIL
jgi:CubicO group peptidase (beta-lactamase class C family)